MTSLAKQLERLAVPHTQSVLGADKKRASLLFDPREAANLDKESVFAIGECGLEELIAIDAQFEQYVAPLFSVASQMMERSQQTREVNDQLDRTLHDFLLLLSPYFPLKSAHKALEWLIYRFHIHQYNVDSLLLCLLPYHDTKVFVRLLQLLKLSDPSSPWHWMENSAKNGVPLSRATIVNRCQKDPGFLAQLSDLVPKFIKCHGPQSPQLRAALALHTSVHLGLLQRTEAITERVVSVIVPRLLTGLKSRCLEWKAATYMVLSQLLTHTRLQDGLMASVLPVLTKYMVGSSLKEALCCLILVYQTQPISSLPKKSFKRVCRQPGMVSLLALLSRSYQTDAFLQVLLTRLVPVAVEMGDGGMYSSTEGSDVEAAGTGHPQYMSLLQAVLEDVELSSDMATYVTKLVVDELVKRRMTVSDTQLFTWQQTARGFLSCLERRYSSKLDEAVSQQMAALYEDDDGISALQEMMALTSMPLRYDIVPDTSTSIHLGLNHAQAHMRALTVAHLGRQIKGGTIQGVTAEFVTSSLKDRWQDDNVSVVQALLNIGQPLLKYLSVDELCYCLQVVLKKVINKEKWISLLGPTLELLCSEPMVEGIPNVSSIILPHLVAMAASASQSEAIKVILRSCLAKKCPLVKAVAKEVQGTLSGLPAQGPIDEDTVTKVNTIVIETVASTLAHMRPNQALEKMKEMANQSNMSPQHQLVVMVMLIKTAEIQKNKPAMQTDGTVQVLLPLLRKAVLKSKHQEKKSLRRAHDKPMGELMLAWGAFVSQNGVVPASFCVRVADILVNKVFNGDLWHEVLIPVMDLLAQQACTSRHKKPWQALLMSLSNLLPAPVFYRAITDIWSDLYSDQSQDGTSAVLRVMAIHLLAKVTATKSGKDLPQWDRKHNRLLVLLLLTLQSPHTVLRHAAVSCLTTLANTGALKAHQGALVKRLVKRAEEIKADPARVAQVVGRLFLKLTSESGPDGDSLSTDLLKLTSVLGQEDMSSLMKLEMTKFLSHVPLLPARKLDYVIAAALDENIARFRENAHQLMESSMLALGDSLLDICGRCTASHTHVATLRLLIHRLDEESAVTITTQEHGLLQMILTAVTLEGAAGAGVSDSPQQMALEQLTKAVFHTIPNVAVQQKIVSSLLDAGVMATSTAGKQRVMRALNHLKLEAGHVSQEFPEQTKGDATVKGQKRTRASRTVLAAVDYPRIRLMLEVLQGRKKVKDALSMANLLFSLLARLAEEDHEDTEYCRQLVLSCLQQICQRWTSDTKPQKQESVPIEQLVKCVRNSVSPVTQQQALILMATIAPLYPDYILHHVISIFTFMGASLLQQEDAYSVQITSNIIQTIIPALSQASEQVGESSAERASRLRAIVCVFVDARHHIPRHRAVALFEQLVRGVGVADQLWACLLMVMESSVRTKDVPHLQDVMDDADKEVSVIDQDIGLCSRVADQFNLQEQLYAMTQALALLTKVTACHPDAAGSRHKQKRRLEVVHTDTLTPAQLRLLQFHGTRMVAALVTRNSFITKVLAAGSEGGLPEALSAGFKSIIELCLTYVTKVNAASAGTSPSAEAPSAQPSLRYWKALQHKVYDILDKACQLLPSGVVLEAVGALLSHSSPALRRKALDMLNSKLGQLNTDLIAKEEVSPLLAMVDRLIDVVTKKAGKDSDLVTCQQLALMSLRLLCRLLGPQHLQLFVPLFAACEGVFPLEEPVAAPAVLASALLCAAELCSCLKAHCIPRLPAFVPALLTTLNHPAVRESNEMVLVCGLTALQKLVTTLPHFLSPYLHNILLLVCELSGEAVEGDDTAAKKSQPALRLQTVRSQIAVAVPPRVLVPVMSQTLEQLMQENQVGVRALVGVCGDHVTSMGHEDLLANINPLLQLLLATLGLREDSSQLTKAELNTTEDRALTALVALVMRLSENSFRPVFYKMYEWATSDDTLSQRHLVWFRLCARLAGTLRSLFNLFVGHTLQLACRALDLNNTCKGVVSYFGVGSAAEADSCALVSEILTCLHQCLLHDTDGFVTSDICKMLQPPLVDQLENSLGGDAAFQRRVTRQVAPCLSQLAVAAKDDALWKAINYNTLLKSRHTDAKVRFASLCAVEEISRALGDEYVTLLPETVPFLAELMEDEEEEVEQKCKDVIGTMEDISGESLQQYF